MFREKSDVIREIRVLLQFKVFSYHVG